MYIMMVMQAVILLHIVAVLCKLGIKQYFYRINNIVEVGFFINNFLSTYLIKNYDFYLVANYLKIMNVTRISSIVMFMKKRWKQKLVEKFKKKRQKLRKNQEKEVINFNKTEKNLVL